MVLVSEALNEVRVKIQKNSVRAIRIGLPNELVLRLGGRKGIVFCRDATDKAVCENISHGAITPDILTHRILNIKLYITQLGFVRGTSAHFSLSWRPFHLKIE